MRVFATVVVLMLTITAPGRAASLTVVIEGLRSHSGILRVALFDNGKGFPKDASRAYSHRSLDLTKQSGDHPPSVVFENLVPGKFAVSVFHDEDGDGRLKTSWLGIPREGIGTSNNPSPLKGPPKFETAAFTFASDLSMTVRISYLKP